MKGSRRSYLKLFLILLLLVPGCGGGRESQLNPNTPDYFAVLQPRTIRWSQFPIRVHADEESIPEVRRAVYVEYVKEAIAEWGRGAGGLSLLMVPVEDPAPRISITWVESLPPSSEGCTGGYTQSNTRGNTLFGMDVRVAMRARSGLAFSSTQVRSPTFHEIGHALGIMAHSPNPADIMYSSLTATALTSRDLATMELLYSSQPVVTDRGM